MSSQQAIPERLHAAIQAVIRDTRNFSERKQELSCRVCRYKDPLGMKLHDPDCCIYELHGAWEEAIAVPAVATPSAEGKADPSRMDLIHPPVSGEAQGSPWLPIETAPKDKQLLFAKAGAENQFAVGMIDSERPDMIWLGVDEVTLDAATHWMPLPAPPSGDVLQRMTKSDTR